MTTPNYGLDIGAEMKRISESHDLARRLARAQFAGEILAELAARNVVGDMGWLIEMCRKEAE